MAFQFKWTDRARNSGLPMAKWQAKFQVWQAKIMMNCQMDNKMAGEIYWTGFVTFATLSTIPFHESIVPDEKYYRLKQFG